MSLEKAKRVLENFAFEKFVVRENTLEKVSYNLSMCMNLLMVQSGRKNMNMCLRVWVRV